MIKRGEDPMTSELSGLFSGVLDGFKRIILTAEGWDKIIPVHGDPEQFWDDLRDHIYSLSKTMIEASKISHVSLHQLLDEYGRLKLWGQEFKAQLPSNARGSLDSHLRHDKELRENVLGLFQHINNQIDRSKCNLCLKT
jgi:hypothetical protein